MERQRETDMERQRDRQTERDRERQTDREGEALDDALQGKSFPVYRAGWSKNTREFPSRSFNQQSVFVQNKQESLTCFMGIFKKISKTAMK